ncbi:hypothetical protein BC937DRAFT_87583 [Endogone sp. FLAS-F59071]|nr:hypothetical protein BC937DRAFT_87583 [Endogone sp. FLAS-F59071]|eukprot:RUS19373.1 hypothetical protein BC937DRAFT_87583 [Endogone sp. FLAS-F59071]
MRYISKGFLLGLLAFLRECVLSLQTPEHTLQRRQSANSTIGSLGNPLSDPQWRAGHAAVVIGDYMVIWGGVASISSNPYDGNSTNDVFVFSLVDHVWYAPNVTAGPGAITPTPQKFHSAWVYSNTQIIYLISTTVDSSSNSICCDGVGRRTVVLDTTSWSWLRGMWDDLDGYFGNTFGVAAASFGGARLMVQGGLVFDGIGSNPQSPIQNYWLYADPDNPQAGWKQYGDPIFLGLGLDTLFDPIYSQLVVVQVPYNLTDSEIWGGYPSRNLSAINGTIPYRRQSHTANCLGDVMVVFGDYQLFQFPESSRVGTLGGGDEMLNPTDGSVYILRYTNNMYVWSASDTSSSSSSPGPRMGHSAVSWGDAIVVFGGWGPNNTINSEVYAFTFTEFGDGNWTIYTRPEEPKNWKLSSGAIAAAVVCPLIIVSLVSIVLVIYIRKRKLQPPQLTKEEAGTEADITRVRSPPPSYSTLGGPTPNQVIQQESSYSATRNIRPTANFDIQQDPIHPDLHNSSHAADIANLVGEEFNTRNCSPDSGSLV